MWIIPALFSSVFLGFYDILRKYSLRKNAVIPVLFVACTAGGMLFIPPVILSVTGVLTKNSFFYIPIVPVYQHSLFLIKSVLVGFSWVFGYYGISKLPLTIAIPIRSTAPMWTLLGALLIFSEKYSTLQWTGIVTILVFFYIFSIAGKHEGINFTKNKWVVFMVIATLLGSTSSLYDKFLLANYDRMAVQAWFSIYMVPVMFIFLVFTGNLKTNLKTGFTWNPAIPFIGIILVVSDFLYFYALSQEGSLIAVVSLVRRSSVIISFFSGAIFFKENNLLRKGIALGGILIGLVLLMRGTIGK